MRRFTAFLLLLMLPLAGVFAVSGAIAHVGGDMEHLAAHLQSVTHHDDEDGAAHGDGDECSGHLATFDAIASVVVVPPSSAVQPLVVMVSVRPIFVEPSFSDPFLEIPPRPPSVAG